MLRATFARAWASAAPAGIRDLPWIAVLVAINATVLFNALLHPPSVGYDASAHLKYIEILSEGRLPSQADTPEFFSPPLPYAIPALLQATGAFPVWRAAKVAQVLNILWSVGLTLWVVRLCERLRPGDCHLKTMALACLGMLPVYYKSFAFVRGEPLLAFLALLVVDRSIDALYGARPGIRDALLLGGALGLLILGRQWGFFVLPAVVLFAVILAARRIRPWRRMAGLVAGSLLVAALAGGWFYLHLEVNAGSFLAFNRSPDPFSSSDLAGKFTLNVSPRVLFGDPVRDRLDDAFIPIFYADLWGDYWAVFTVYGKDLRDGKYLAGSLLQRLFADGQAPEWLETNRFRIAGYLGRVNLVSVLPSAILAAGLLLGAASLVRFLRRPPPDERAGILPFLFLVVAASCAGYAGFVALFPRHDVVKATYLLQALPFLAILAAEFLRTVRQRSAALHRVLLAILALAILHAAPLFVTHYSPLF